MADISAKTAVNVTNDVKLRPNVTDAVPTDAAAASQFMDVMAARMTTPNSDDNDLKDAAKKSDDVGNARDANLLRHLKGLKNKKNAETVNNPEAAAQTQTIKAKLKEKIKARVQEIASSNDIPVKDDASLKTLQSVAKFLIKASDEGKIDLPPELVEKLQAFLAKGDDLKAFDIATFLRDFCDTFKTMLVSLNDKAPVEGEDSVEDKLLWPKELVDQLKDLKLNGLVKEDKYITAYDAVRLVKALVNAGEKAAIATLDEKIEKALLPKDRADILVTAAAKDAKPKAASAELNVDTTLEVGKDLNHIDTDVDTDVDTDIVSVLTKAAPSKQKADAKDAPVAGKLELPADIKAEPKDKPAQPLNNSPALNAALRMQLSASASSTPADVKSASPAVAAASNIVNSAALDGLNNVAGNNGPRFSAALNAVAEANKPSEATQQVVIQLQQRGNKPGSLSVQLTPAELGRVDVRLTPQRDGSVHAVIAADKPETLALLQKDASSLERALQNAGINANAGNMSFNLREQRQSQQFDGGRKRFSRADIEETSTKEIALNVTDQGVFTKDHVNYHA